VTVNGNRVVLAQKEFELLLRLARDPERVCTKQELLRDVWGVSSATGVRTRTVDSHASRLRRKLAEHATREYVVNQWGVGDCPANQRCYAVPVPTLCPNNRRVPLSSILASLRMRVLDAAEYV
jgi:hypothetical protein